jgi:pimeloyl-ACP methyl ester carboxylesterase
LHVLKTIFTVLFILLIAIIVHALFSVTMARIYLGRIDHDGEYITVGKEKLYIEVSGAGDPIILIHGFLGSHFDFESIVEELSTFRKVYAVDLPGFGLSRASLEGDYSRKGYADLVSALMHILNIDRADILGHSMGGEIALNLAYYYPERVKSLILVDSMGYSKMDFLSSLIEGNEFLNHVFMRYFFQTYMVQRFTFRQKLGDVSKFNREFFNLSFSLIDHVSPAFLYRLNSQNDSGALSERIGDIKSRTLIIWGEKDRIAPVADGERLKTDILGSELEIITGAGHLPMLEDPHLFLEKLKHFLN